MIETVAVSEGLSLDAYAAYAHLVTAVQDLRREARILLPRLGARKVWMINSTATGGGVAEMLPRMISLLRELGVDIDWLTIAPAEDDFFTLTKRLHNLIHGVGDPHLGADDRALYERISQQLAEALQPRIGPDDILVIHDPQPAGVGALLEKSMPGLVTIWRCHIGLDEDTPQTRAAWSFLEPHVTAYDHAVFSAPEYIPPFMAGRSTIIAPAIDPLTAKNRPLSVHSVVGILCNAGLMNEHQPVMRPPYDAQAQRLAPDGSFGSALDGDEVGMLYRPVVTQVSRWDRLKGWKPLLDAFALLKRSRDAALGLDDYQRRRLDLVRLLLVGPDPSSVSDDPEGADVLAELVGAYRDLEPAIQRDVALLSLPMSSRYENALMVNALQLCSSVVVQNSLREGFGLTATEAMFKQRAVLGTTACGLRQQIRDHIDGRLHPDAEDAQGLAQVLVEMLSASRMRDEWGRNAQRRVYDEFLIFAQLRKWLRLLARARGGRVASPSSAPALPVGD